MASLFGYAVALVIAGWLWFFIVRPILEDWGVISVKSSEPVMERAQSAPLVVERTNDRTNERSPHDSLWQEFLLDRTRLNLIAVMVDSDLTVTEIRGLLKGTSEIVGEEIEAERRRQGKPTSQPYQTPIAGRPTAAKFASDPS